MKSRIYCLVILLLTFSYLKSQSLNTADTKGELTINGMGAANYKVPIALPPGIKEIAPQVALIYSSSGNNGIAGYGWNIVGISSITRIGTRIDLDGYIDGVDFDENDQFALDGQRLIKESRALGDGSKIYYTESYSNLKIKSSGSFTYPGASGSGPEKFEITFPDGTQAFYGSTSNSRGVSEWLIDKWIDTKGNTIEYEYANNGNVTYIRFIRWSKNATIGTNGYENLMEFVYKNRVRPEMAYLHGIAMRNNWLLDRIEVRTGGELFRKYQLTHFENELKYQNISQIQEFNGDNEPANPIVFNYENSQGGFDNFLYYNSTENNYLDKVMYSGDFDGNGKLDFVVNSGGTKLFMNSIDDNSWNSINVPNPGGEKLIPPISTLQNGKMMQLQSLVFKTENTSTGSYHENSIQENHKLYLKPQILNTNNNQFTDNYTRTIAYPYLNYAINSDGCMNMGTRLDKYTGTPYTKFLEGDFNGDGISDYILLGRYEVNNIFVDPSPMESNNTTTRPIVGCNPHINYQNISPYFINMNPLISDDEAILKISSGLYIGFDDKQFVIDFDGDGKMDILNITSNGSYKVYAFTNPLQPETLASGTISEYNLSIDSEKQLVWGDFNGDGKMDLMIPHAKDNSNWSMYLSKGNSFERVVYNDFMLYLPYWKGSPAANRVRIKQYRAVDLNNDGKSDFIMNEYESWTHWINDRNARGHFYMKPNLGLDSSGKIAFGEEQHTQVFSEYGYDDAIHLLTGDYNNGNHDIIFIQGKQIWKGKYKKDQSKDARLKTVNEVGGKIVSEVTYGPLTPNSSNGGLGDANGTYFSSNQENYPFVEIKQLPNLNVVTKIKVSAMGESKEQFFKYFGITSHSQGWGILGFKILAQSSWVSPGVNTKIWQVSQTSPSLRGAAIGNWSFSGDNLNLITNPIDNQLLNRSETNYFTQNLLQKRYVQLPSSQWQTDFLTGVTNTNSSEFDSYYNIKKSVTKKLLGETVQATYTTNYTYANNPSGTGVNYFIGRLTKKNEIANAYNDTRTSEVKYTYTGSLLTKTETKGHNTDYITETFGYDGYGNIIQTTTSAPGVSSRTISNEYDNNGRFVKKKTNVDGLVTNLTYNKLGQVLTVTDPFNVITMSSYDHWGKLMTITISGASTTPLVTSYGYSRDSNGLFIVTSENTQTKEYSETHTDVLGRTFKTITKGFGSGTKIAKTTEYDFLGRVTRESEPYFTTGAPSQWNTIEYDYLSRPVKQISFTGKTANISYNGLSATTTENGKTKIISKDAVGNVVSVSDNGQILNYNYYANNELKSTIYGSHTVTIGIDGWGRKISLLDPSVSSTAYTYSFNNYSEILTETTPNGTTSYTYTPTGRLNSKTIIGDNTDISVNYLYNTKGLITQEFGTSDGTAYSAQYYYDSMHRLNRKQEWMGDNNIEKSYAYDDFGRISTETTKVGCATCINILGASSTLVVKNNYNTYNGILDHITDNTSGATIWKLTGANQRMQTLSAQLGNGVNISNTYNTLGYIQNVRHTKSNIAPLSLDYTFNAQKGTLTNRKNNFYNYTENFTYDNIDRLLSWTTPTGVESNVYEADGRIMSNSNIGSFSYDANAKYKKKNISLNTSGRSYFTGRTPQTVTYNAFKKPVSITEANRGTIEFEYGIYGVRNKAIEWTTDLPSGNIADILRTKLYSSDGSVEIIIKGAEGSPPPQGIGGIETYGTNTEPFLRIITYIGGNAYSAPAMYVKTYSGTAVSPIIDAQIHYLHRDFQGSIMAITDQVGNVIERRHFDAWGNLSKFTDADGITQTNPDFMGGEMFFDRGYTGHEHFFRVGIIHMNGRIYDPVLKTFLSPDNFIQDPQNSQNYNRYGYAFNNPLMYTDPSGEIFGLSAVVSAAIIGAVIGGTVYTGMALYNGNFTWGGLLKSVGIGAISGVAAYGVGTLAAQMMPAAGVSNFGFQFGKATFQMSMHGISQGFIAGISGGDIGQGFISGMMSSAISSLVGSVGGRGEFDFIQAENPYTQMFFGTVSGGLGAKLSGGNFWEGAAVGLTVSALNHGMHKMYDPVKKSFRQQMRAKGIKPGGRFGYTRNEHNNIIGAVEELNDLHSNVSSKIEEIVYHEGGFVNERGQEGSAAAQMQQNGRYSLHVSQTRVVTNLDYAYRVGHELYHIFDNGNMTYTQWMNQTERQLYESEIRTYKNFDLMNNIPGAMNRIIYYQQLINNLPK